MIYTLAYLHIHNITNLHMYAAHTQFIYSEEYIDVTGNEEWFRRYKYDIPVIHLNGRLLMMHRIDEQKLRTALNKLKDNVL